MSREAQQPELTPRRERSKLGPPPPGMLVFTLALIASGVVLTVAAYRADRDGQTAVAVVSGSLAAFALVVGGVMLGAYVGGRRSS